MEAKDGKVRPKQKMCFLEWMICIYVLGIFVGGPFAFAVYLLIMHEWFYMAIMLMLTAGMASFFYHECTQERREKYAD
jgi:hypothetical protein